MKHILALSIIASSMALTACGGGDSDSSGSNYTSTFKKILSNGNEYTCSTQASFDACKDDASCKAASCTLTKEVTKPVITPTLTPCLVSGNFITGQKGTSCSFSIPNYNSGAISELECPTTGGVRLGGMVAGGIIQLGNYTLQCK